MQAQCAPPAPLGLRQMSSFLVGLTVMSQNFYPYLGNAFLDLLDDYAKYKGKTNFPAALAGDIFL